VEAELFKEASLLARDGLSESELKRTKAKILGQKKIGRQDPGNLAMTLALDELYGLGYAYADEEDAHYEAVTGDQVRAVAKHYLDPNRAVAVVLAGTEDQT
jgi:predicted Zn-dependent peptidase